MKKQKSLQFNFIMNILLTMSSFIFPLITFPYVSRILLPVGTGKVSFAMSIVAYFSMFAQLGIPTYGIRACAKVRDNKGNLTKIVHELMMINLITCIVAYLLFFIALFYVPRLREDRILFIIVSSTILFNAIGVEWLYKALEQYAYITTRSIIFKFIALVAMFLFVKEQSDYIIYGAISIFAASASNILNFLNLRKYIEFHKVGSYEYRKHLKSISVFFAMTIATTIYTNLDTVMLGFIKTDVEVGYYNAAIKVKSILLSIVTALGTVLLPRVSYYIEQGLQEEFRNITMKALNFVILFASPMLVYFILFARQGIEFLSGPAYGGAVLPMQIIMPTLLLIGMTNIMGIQMLVPMGREKTVLYSVMAGALVNLVLNTILIPRYSSSGAAFGTLIAEVVVLLVQIWVLRDVVVPLLKKVKYDAIVIGLILGTIACRWIIEFNLSNFMTLLVSAVIFFGVYGLVLNILREPLVMEIEGQILKKYIKKFKI